jgi:glutamine---fructose-6-phosphate transaminase (isomerizing)
MCGIVAGVAERDVVPILLEGLKRLEYRGYDSAGVAVIAGSTLQRTRLPGKVAALAAAVATQGLRGSLGIAHTRWATHGTPTEKNAHPHICRDRVAVVHNGIIENHEALRTAQLAAGYCFTSETDTEVIAHQIVHHLEQGGDLLAALRATLSDLNGAYALAVMATDTPDQLIVARRGSPLVIGIGIGEHFIASDVAALLPVTRQFIFLEEGDVAVITRQAVAICDAHGHSVTRSIKTSNLSDDAVERGHYRHYMQKEIHEQPRAIADTLEGRIAGGRVLEAAFGPNATAIFDRVRRVQIIACGTSYHAGMVARNWFEGLAGIPCQVEVASEFRYRHPVVAADALVVAISQSGETADTLAALRACREWGFGPSLAICNVAESSLVRETDLTLMTRAGIEIGVASTKAFTTQLVALLMLVMVMGRRFRLSRDSEAAIVAQLEALPRHCEEILAIEPQIEQLAELFVDKRSALFLGRGVQYPVALEGALKLKEISYIHAEAYPAGELKHGPLALIDEQMPVVAVAPNDELIEKLKSNLQEVRARNGQIYLFADHASEVSHGPNLHVILVPPAGPNVAPIAFTLPLQLLAYHVAVLRGTDVDQPRNLAKSVTVE